MVRNAFALAAMSCLFAATTVSAQPADKPTKDTYDQAVARHLETARQDLVGADSI